MGKLATTANARTRRRGVDAASAPAFNVVTDIAWSRLYYAGGPLFQAQGLANNATMNGSAGQTFPDEITSNAANLNAGSGVYKSASSNMNGQPCVEVAAGGVGCLRHSTTVAAGAQVALPISIIVIFYQSSVSGYVVDGANEGNTGQRVLLRSSSGPVWSLYMGTDRTGGTPVAGISACRISATSSNDLLTANGSTVISGVDSGGGTWVGMSFTEGGGVQLAGGQFALYGVYSGDITAATNWSGLQAWVSSTYGKSLS